MVSIWGTEQKRRTPSKALRSVVYRRDKGSCGICFKKVDPFEFELAHNKAHSRGGKLTAANTFVAHASCNRSQGALSRNQVRKTLGIETSEDKVRTDLKGLTIAQLKYLAKKHQVKVKGKVVKSFLWGDSQTPPTKLKYVNALARVVSKSEVTSASNYTPTVKKRAKRKSNSSWPFF